MDSAVSLPWKYTQTVQMSMQCCTQVLSSADILIQTFLGALDICKYHYCSWHSSWIFKIIISLFLLCRTLHLHKVENAVSEKKKRKISWRIIVTWKLESVFLPTYLLSCCVLCEPEKKNYNELLSRDNVFLYITLFHFVCCFSLFAFLKRTRHSYCSLLII